MNRIRITKEFTFEMAHALYGHDGACKNIHGHSYKLFVTLIGQPKLAENHPKDGMVFDFSELKKIVKERIIDHFDHALVLNGNSPHRELASENFLKDKIVMFENQPTCENLLLFFVSRLIGKLPSEVELHSMRLHETATAYAEWFAGDQVK